MLAQGPSAQVLPELQQPHGGSSPAAGIIGTLQPTLLPTDLLTASALWEQSWASFAVLRAPSASVRSHLCALL